MTRRIDYQHSDVYLLSDETVQAIMIRSAVNP